MYSSSHDAQLYGPLPVVRVLDVVEMRIVMKIFDAVERNFAAAANDSLLLMSYSRQVQIVHRSEDDKWLGPVDTIFFHDHDHCQ